MDNFYLSYTNPHKNSKSAFVFLKCKRNCEFYINEFGANFILMYCDGNFWEKIWIAIMELEMVLKINAHKRVFLKLFLIFIFIYIYINWQD